MVADFFSCASSAIEYSLDQTGFLCFRIQMENESLIIDLYKT
jgi:hypothetical protein